MATFPIPAEYITTGNGPGQIPVRDQRGAIPGVPLIYNRMTTDEVAETLRELLPSGFLRGGVLRGTLDEMPFRPNHIYLDGRQKSGVEVIVDGFRLKLTSDLIAIDAGLPPAAGKRDDLVFIEVWFVRSPSGGRSPMWRLRVVHDVDFEAHPEGLGSPQVTAQGPHEAPSTVAFEKYPANHDFDRDPGLYVAAFPGKANDPINEVGLDGQPYYLVYAIPVARLKRVNMGGFDPLTNQDGASEFTPNGVSLRPDGLWSNALDGAYQIVDLRHWVSVEKNYEGTFRTALYDHLTHKLTSGGVRTTVFRELDQRGQLSYFGDTEATDQISIPVNLVRNSHFQADSDGNTVADGWAKFQTNQDVSGQCAMATPRGQVIMRTNAVASERFGIEKTLTGFFSRDFHVQISFVIHSTDADTRLVLEATRLDGSVAFAVDPGKLSELPLGERLSFERAFRTPDFESELKLRWYLIGGAGEVLLDLVDIKTDVRPSPVVELGDGSAFTILRSPALTEVGAVFTGARLFDNVTGQQIGFGSSPDGSKLEFNLGMVPTNADLRVVADIEYPAGAGFPDLFEAPTKAWDHEGYVGLVNVQNLSDTMTEVGLGQRSRVLGGRVETVVVYNPRQTQRGVVTTYLISGNGTGSYVIPAKLYGRNSLMPLDVRVDGSSQQLSRVERLENGSIAIELANNAYVPMGDVFEVDVAMDAPILLWDERLNGAISLSRNMAMLSRVTGTGRQLVFTAPGIIVGRTTGLVCSNLFVNGVALDSSQITRVDGYDTPVIVVTLADALEVGSSVEFIGSVRYEAYPGSNVALSYAVAPDARVELGTDVPMTLLTQPMICAHTKGTAGQDLDGDFGSTPFVRDPLLMGNPIKIANQLFPKSALFDLPIHNNTLGFRPLHAGRVITLAELASGLNVEATPLVDAAPHRVLLTALVEVRGRVYLLVLTETRTDERNLITENATVALYEPNGRPISTANL